MNLAAQLAAVLVLAGCCRVHAVLVLLLAHADTNACAVFIPGP